MAKYTQTMADRLAGELVVLFGLDTEIEHSMVTDGFTFNIRVKTKKLYDPLVIRNAVRQYIEINEPTWIIQRVTVIGE